jgi:hypothetical protein
MIPNVAPQSARAPAKETLERRVDALGLVEAQARMKHRLHPDLGRRREAGRCASTRLLGACRANLSLRCTVYGTGGARG